MSPCMGRLGLAASVAIKKVAGTDARASQPRQRLSWRPRFPALSVLPVFVSDARRHNLSYARAGNSATERPDLLAAVAYC
jgi:hypothetical protein